MKPTFVSSITLIPFFTVVSTIVPVMVNFVYQLDWAKDAKIPGKTLLLGVSVRTFLENISI